jgi:hypothetical protein
MRLPQFRAKNAPPSKKCAGKLPVVLEYAEARPAVALEEPGRHSGGDHQGAATLLNTEE